MRTVPGLEHLRIPDERLAELTDKAHGTEDASGAHLTSMRRKTYSSTWGTPPEIIAIVIDLFGTIDLDLASSAEHNKIVGARAFFSEDNPCPDAPEVLPGDVCYSNPPGPSVFVQDFWKIWLGCIDRGAVGGFLIFNTDNWRGLSEPKRQHPVILLKKRVRYVGAPSSASFPSALVLSPDVVTVPDEYGHVVEW
jgi:hypothetical protein